MAPAPSTHTIRLLMLAVLVLVAPTDQCSIIPAQDDAGSNKVITEIELTDRVPYGRNPVDYFGSSLSDAVAKLNQRLTSGDTVLLPDDRFGYLPAVLEQLDVPLESQLLVYSKTARTPDLVSPRTPRALFFNDEVSVAWIPDARELEITAVDPIKGINFYTLSQPLDASESRKASRSTAKTSGTEADSAALTFQRRDRCLACHAGRSSLGIPGLLLRAFQTDRTGKPLVGFSRVTHDMLYRQRWGGWYVTGSPASVIHRGNLVSQADNTRQKQEPGFATTTSDLSQKFDTSGYPYPDSDFIAHLVLAHQVQGTNLLIRAGMESRLKRRSDVEAQLLRYFVFADEPPLELSRSDANTVLRNSKFAASFVDNGLCDDSGCSLRDLSLEKQVFKYRLSYLIHSRLFQALPDDCRNRLLRKLWVGLTAERPSDDFSHLPEYERRQIVEIVRATVAKLPDCWSDRKSPHE